MAREIVAIENTGDSTKLIVKEEDNYSSVSLPYGILHIRPIEYDDAIHFSPPDELFSNS
jgi:hypothetical protein